MFRDALLRLMAAYESAYAIDGGRSLARVATIVLNRGAFFTRIKEGRDCSLRSLSLIVDWLSVAQNWPGGIIPDDGLKALHSIGCCNVKRDSEVLKKAQLVSIDAQRFHFYKRHRPYFRAHLQQWQQHS